MCDEHGRERGRTHAGESYSSRGDRLHQQHAAGADASTTAVKTTNEVEQYAIKAATENGRNIGAMQLQLANEAIESRAIEKNEADAIKGMTEIEDATDQEDQAQDEKERGEEKERSDPYDNAKKIAVVPSLLLCALTAKNPSLLPNVLWRRCSASSRTSKGYTDHGQLSPAVRSVLSRHCSRHRVSSLESRPLILHIVQALAKSSAPAPLPKACVNACETLAIESAKDRDSSLPDAYMEVALFLGP